MTHQTTLSDAQFARIEPLLPPPSNHLKTPHRQVLGAWLYVYYQDCTWRGLPREFGNWDTIYVRLNRWAKVGVLERVVRASQQELLVELDADNPVPGLHDHPPAHARRRRAANSGRQAIGRSRSLPPA